MTRCLDGPPRVALCTDCHLCHLTLWFSLPAAGTVCEWREEMDAVVLRFCFCFLKMISFRISFVCHSVLLSWVQFVIRYLLRQCIFCMRDSPVFVCKLGFKNIFRIAFSNEGTLKFLSFPGGTFLSFFLPSRERVVFFFFCDWFIYTCVHFVLFRVSSWASGPSFPTPQS